MVFAVRKFHKYIHGRRFTLNTDHKPLISIFKPGEGISAHAANRLQRWALIPLKYNFEIQYKNTKEFGEADAPSWLISEKQKSLEAEDKVIAAIETDVQDELLRNVERMPITADIIRSETQRCPTLRLALKYKALGQWLKLEKENEHYNLVSRKEDLSIVGDCLMFRNRVVIPENLKEKVLQTLYEGHPGMTRMKSTAREYAYWNNIDKDIENTVKPMPAGGQMPNKGSLNVKLGVP